MNRAVEYLTRNPAFLRKLREAVFPYPEDPTKKCFRFEARRAVETEYHIELPANAEFDSFEECVELIRQQNAFSPAVVPQISPRLSPVRKEAPEELFSECPPAAPRIYWEYSSHPYVEDGRFVALRVDLTRTKEEVLRDFGRCYDELVATWRSRRRRRYRQEQSMT